MTTEVVLALIASLGALVSSAGAIVVAYLGKRVVNHPDKKLVEVVRVVVEDAVSAPIRDMEREWADWHRKLTMVAGRIDKQETRASRRAAAREDPTPAAAEPEISEAEILRRAFG